LVHLLRKVHLNGVVNILIVSCMHTNTVDFLLMGSLIIDEVIRILEDELQLIEVYFTLLGLLGIPFCWGGSLVHRSVF
jgi:hypothetical protein